jgi:hypothetical protein
MSYPREPEWCPEGLTIGPRPYGVAIRLKERNACEETSNRGEGSARSVMVRSVPRNQ